MFAALAQSVERRLGKAEVGGSIPLGSFEKPLLFKGRRSPSKDGSGFPGCANITASVVQLGDSYSPGSYAARKIRFWLL